MASNSEFEKAFPKPIKRERETESGYMYRIAEWNGEKDIWLAALKWVCAIDAEQLCTDEINITYEKIW